MDAGRGALLVAGTTSDAGKSALVAGRVGEVAEQIATARRRVRDSAGWVMDVYLLRRAA